MRTIKKTVSTEHRMVTQTGNRFVITEDSDGRSKVYYHIESLFARGCSNAEVTKAMADNLMCLAKTLILDAKELEAELEFEKEKQE